jgi:hypothetical protein
VTCATVQAVFTTTTVPPAAYYGRDATGACVAGPGPSVPGGCTTYIGPDTGNPSITFGNFVMQYQTATTNLRLRTVAGTEAINYYSLVTFGSAQFDTAANMAVTTAFQTLGDPGVVEGQEARRIFLGPTATGDGREYTIDFHSISTGKIAMRACQW